MAFSGRAWAVSGSKTPANIARIIASAATAGASGVGGPLHCRVTASGAPDGNVHIAPGNVVMASRYPGAGLESYVDYNDSDFAFPIAPTGSAGGRTDYLVVRIEDPAFPGQAAPANPITGPFTKVQVLNTDPRVTPPAFPFLLLAVITIPANTTAITQAMINSGPGVREMVNPRTRQMRRAYSYPSTIVVGNKPSGTWEKPHDSVTQFDVPDWATSAEIAVTIAGVRNDTADFNGQMYAEFCGKPTANVAIDSNIGSGGNGVRLTLVTGGGIPITSDKRKTFQDFKVWVKRSAPTTGKLTFTSGTTILIDITFYEAITEDLT